MSKADIFKLIKNYHAIASVLMWTIIAAIIQIFICGFLLNFLIIGPYCDVKHIQEKLDKNVNKTETLETIKTNQTNETCESHVDS